MKVRRISYGRTANLGDSEIEHLLIQCELREGDDPLEVHEQMKQWVEARLYPSRLDPSTKRWVKRDRPVYPTEDKN